MGEQLGIVPAIEHGLSPNGRALHSSVLSEPTFRDSTAEARRIRNNLEEGNALGRSAISGVAARTGQGRYESSGVSPEQVRIAMRAYRK